MYRISFSTNNVLSHFKKANPKTGFKHYKWTYISGHWCYCQTVLSSMPRDSVLDKPEVIYKSHLAAKNSVGFLSDKKIGMG